MDQPSQSPSSSSNTKIFLIGGLIILCCGVAVYLFSRNVAPTPTPVANVSSPSATNTQPNPAPTPDQQAAFKDGVYSADGSYRSPAGAETVGVTVTLANGIITDSSIKVEAQAPISKNFQTMFGDNYKQYVIGKKISDLSLTKVSGSSLTPHGFNDAIEKIKAEAHS